MHVSQNQFNMKHFYTLLLAMGLAASSVSAQNVIVVMKDGNKQKFNADYLSEIKFVDPSTPVVNFEQLTPEPYGNGNASLGFRNEEENITLRLDIYGSKDAVYLEDGTYTVSSTNEPMTIDSDVNYTYLMENSADKQAVTGGTMTVSSYENQYTVKLDLILDGEREYKGEYSGKLTKYAPFLEGQMSAASYLANAQPAGQFYVKMNDADWNYEIAMVMVADKEAQTLPVGTYKFSDSTSPGSLTSLSYVDTFNPGSNNKLAAGSEVFVTAGDTEGEYDILMNLTFQDGRKAKFTYSGPITGTPNFSFDGETLDTLESTLYSNGANVTLLFKNSTNPDFEICLDTYCDEATYFQPGIYTVGGSTKPYIELSNITYTYVKRGDQTIAVKSGEMRVTLEDDIYTFQIDIVLEGDETYKGEYKGKLSNFGPVVILNLDQASYNYQARPAGNFYVKLSDTAYSCEMALDIYGDTAATTLPAGTYTYSTDKTPGTFGPESYVNLYSPFLNSNNKLAEGSTVTVNKEGENYTIAMNLNFVDGRKAVINYSGTFTNSPNFE